MKYQSEPLRAINRRIEGRLRAAKTISLLWLGSIMGAGCAFITQAVLARQLGPAAFGAFAAAFGMVTLVAPLASFGVGSFWLRAFGQEGWGGRRWLRNSLKYSMLTTALALTALCLWAEFGPHDAASRDVLIVLSVYLLGQVAVELVSAKLQLEERYIDLALWQFLPHLLRLLSVLIIAFAMMDILTPLRIAMAYAVISAAIGGLGILSLWRLYLGSFDLKGHGSGPGKVNIKVKPTSLLQVAAQSWPFGLAGVFYLVYFQSDIILLKYIKGDEAAGNYNVAFIIIVAVYMLPSVIYQKFLMPKIHRWAEHDKVKFRQIYLFGNRLMLVFGLVAMVLIWALGPVVLRIAFGTAFPGSETVLSVLAMAVPVRFVATSVGSILSTRDFMRVKVKLMAATAAFNVGLNLALIPKYGILGAAASTVACDALLLMLYFLTARHFIFRS